MSDDGFLSDTQLREMRRQQRLQGGGGDYNAPNADGFVPVQTRPNYPAPQKREDMSGFGNGVTSFLHGANTGFYMGANDQLQAAANPENYARAMERNAQHPYANAVGNIVGGTLGAVVTAPLTVGRATGLGGRMVWSGIQGGAQGGITAYNEARAQGQGYADALKRGAAGAAMGLVGGATGQGIGEAVAPPLAGATARAFTEAPPSMGPSSGPNKYASDTISRSMDATGNTPGRITKDMQHLPDAWMADHPGMVHAQKELNRLGGEGHADFAREAVERISPEAKMARAQQDIRNPPQTYGSQLEAQLAQEQKNVGQAIDTLPPVPTDGLRQNISGIIDAKGAAMPDPHLNRLGTLENNLWSNDVLPGQTLHNTKDVLDQSIGGNSGHGADIAARQEINAAIKNAEAQTGLPVKPYTQANERATLLHGQKDAYALGRGGKEAHTVNDVIGDTQNKLPNHPGIEPAMTEAYQGGMMDRRNFYNGPFSRERVYERTAGVAQRNPEAVQEAVNLSIPTIAGTAGAAGGVPAAIGAAATQVGGSLISKVFKPGEPEAKTLARILRLTGPERDQVMREIAERSATVSNRSKIIERLYKAGAQGLGASTAATGGELLYDTLNQPKKQAR